jgi:hypothetical protein
MLQIDHVYDFFKTNIFKQIQTYSLSNGIYPTSIEFDRCIFNIFSKTGSTSKIMFIDQEPILKEFVIPSVKFFKFPDPNNYSVESYIEDFYKDRLPYSDVEFQWDLIRENPKRLFKDPVALCVSEKSEFLNELCAKENLKILYYFFHGFAATDWYRGFYALNYNKSVVQEYEKDFVSFNRIVTNDRSYRCYFVSMLESYKLIDNGQISFGIASDCDSWQSEITNQKTKLSSKAINHIEKYLPTVKTPLVVDQSTVSGYASADIPRVINDSFWHIVTETVFYYEKLHLTEKIFKPIVMKQPFMLLAAPGNLEYLRSYGFKTFDGIIDESYDHIQDPDLRIEAVVKQLDWYCRLSPDEKRQIMIKIEPIVEYNFHHFYGEFKNIIANELLGNCQQLFKEIGHDDSTIAYEDIYKTLIN